MKKALFIATAATVVIANALALVHVMRNRFGKPDAEVILTQRELRYFDSPMSRDDSGVTLHLVWLDPARFPLPAVQRPSVWLDRHKLQTLGFACDVDPSSPEAEHYYRRQRPRKVFVALEYDGAGWRTWFNAYQRAIAEANTYRSFGSIPSIESDSSHLVAIDADLHSGQLRKRHPDRTAIIILPAVIAISLTPSEYMGAPPDPAHPPKVVGLIQELPSSLHVPLPYSHEFRRRYREYAAGRGPRQEYMWNENFHYRVHLRYGASFEPWVTSVEFIN